MEEVVKTVENICGVTNSQFTPILDFLKDVAILEDQKNVKDIKLKVGQYIVQNEKLYKKTALGLGLFCVAKECYDGVMFEAYEGECDSYSGAGSYPN